MSYIKLLHNFLENSNDLFPDKQALYHNNIWYTYKEINDRSNQLAHYLLSLGLKKGDRLALLLENSFEYVVSYYAILKIGAITVALNTENTREDINFILDDCGVNLVITNQKYLKKVKERYEHGKLLNHILVWSKQDLKGFENKEKRLSLLPRDIDSFSSKNPSINVIDLDVASIVYTSGSTGKPRGATLTHLNIITNTHSIVKYLDLSSNDRIMVVLPFYYIYGKSLLNTHFFVGGSVVIDNRFLYPNVVLNTMMEQMVTGFSGVPSTFTILLHRSNIRSHKFDHLRYVTQAGGAMAPAIQKEVAKVFHPAKFFIMYGATEASARLSYLDPNDLPRKWGSIGKAIPNVELFIADDKGHPLRQGEQGEIVARGANIMRGYWNHPEETRKVLRNGLYYTGDVGVMDDDGFLFVIGRNKDMIKIGGNRVSAKEIEEVLYEHPDVADAAVIGIYDEILGEAIKAFIVPKNGNLIQDRNDLIMHFLKSKLAPYKLPKYLEFRDTLPKNKSGKVLKMNLK